MSKVTITLVKSNLRAYWHERSKGRKRDEVETAVQVIQVIPSRALWLRRSFENAVLVEECIDLMLPHGGDAPKLTLLPSLMEKAA